MRLSTISIAALALASATPAFAQDEADTNPFTITGNVTAVSDYRFRGLSQSHEGPAAQGGLTVSHETGLYANVWASTIDDKVSLPGYGAAEVDFSGGWTKTFDNGLGVDVGLLYYFYADAPKGNKTDFFEPYATVSYTTGPVTAKVGANYAWSQEGLADNDNIYVRGDLAVAIPGTPLTATGHIGYTDGYLGVLSPDSKYMDWSVGAEAVVQGVKVGVQYVDTDISATSNVLFPTANDIGADATVLGYVGFSF